MKRRSIKSTTPGLSSCEVLPAFRSYKEVSWQNGQGLDQIARFSLLLVASALKALSLRAKVRNCAGIRSST